MTDTYTWHIGNGIICTRRHNATDDAQIARRIGHFYPRSSFFFKGVQLL